MKKGFLIISLFVISLSIIAQGPYAPSAGEIGSTAIHRDSSAFGTWATACTITRGLQDISNASIGNTNVGTNTSAIGKSGLNGVVSLGDGGSATLTFPSPIINGLGADFAVFENGFKNINLGGFFLELAFVEVSSDGVNFFRFDAISLTDNSIQTSGFGTTHATNLYNLAGKYKSSYGTPFDLDELAGISGLNINNITHIKVIDVVGNINPIYASYDSQNSIINDPWPTPFGSSGFDLDAIGVINSTTTKIAELNNNNSINIFPNPFKNILTIQLEQQQNYEYVLLNLNGKNVKSGAFSNSQFQINLTQLKSGIYFLQLKSEQAITTQKVIKL